MNRKHTGCLVALIVLLVSIAGVTAAFALGIPAGFQVLKLAERTMEQPNLSGSVTVTGTEFSMEAEFYWCDLADERYVCVNAQGLELYCHDEVVYFDNGRGYDLSALFEPLVSKLEDFSPYVLLLAGFHQEQADGEMIYTLTLDEEKLRLLERFAPEAASGLSGYEGSVLTLSAVGGELTGLELFMGDLTIHASMDSSIRNTIPPEVMIQISGGDVHDPGEVLPLLLACQEAAGENPFGADVQLQVACGPLPISDTAQVYATENALYFTRGGTTTELPLSGTDELFLGLAWTFCRDGSVVTSPDGAVTYSASVDAAYLDELFRAVLPELEGLGISFGDGSLTLTVENSRLSQMGLTCSGEMPFLVTTIPVDVSLALNRMAGEVSLPEGIE